MFASRLYVESLSFAAIRVLTSISAFVVLSVGARSLAPTEFTLLAVMSSSYALVSMCDFGVGMAAQSVAACTPRSEQLRVWLLAGRITLRIALCLTPMAILVATVSGDPIVVGVGLVAALLCLPVSLVDRYRAVRQQVSITSVVSLANAVATVLVALILARLDLGIYLVLVPIGSTLFTQSIHAAVTLAAATGRQRHLPRPAASLPAGFKTLAGRFLVMQVSAALIFQTDVLILAFLVSTADFAGYPVALRVAVAGAAVLGSVTQAFWPHIAAADASTATDELSRVKRLTGLLVAGCLAVGGLCLSGVFHHLMVGAFAEQAPSPSLLALVFVFLAAFVLTNALSQIAIALGRVRLQSRCAWATIGFKVVCTPLAVWQFGPTATLVVSALVLLLTNAVPTWLALRAEGAGQPEEPLLDDEMNGARHA